MPWLAGFITSTPESDFSVRTAGETQADVATSYAVDPGTNENDLPTLIVLWLQRPAWVDRRAAEPALT